MGENDKNRTGTGTGAGNGMSQAFSNIAGGLGGLTSMLTASDGNAQIADTSQQWGAINGLNSVGRGSYNSFAQLATDSTNLQSVQPDLDYDAIRGGSTGQRIGSTLSSTMSGAAAGAQVGGVYGAIAGAAIGLGKGVTDWISGNQSARNEQSILRSEQNTAQALAQQRMNNAADSLADANFGTAYANRAARGGQLERGTIDIRDFADSVLHRQRQSDQTHSAGLVRRHCKGGVMIRIKR